MLKWIYCQNYIVKKKKHSQLGPKLSFKMTYSAFKLYIYHYGSSGNWTLDLDVANIIQMPCSWATGTQKDVWQRLYNYLPFPEVLSFPCERCISMVINFKNKDQSVSMPMPKSKSITLTALTPPPPPPQISQATFYGWRELAAFPSLSPSYWNFIRFAIWYISIHGISYSSLYNVRKTLQTCCLWQKLWMQPYAAEPGTYINRNSGPLLSMFN